MKLLSIITYIVVNICARVLLYTLLIQNHPDNLPVLWFILCYLGSYKLGEFLDKFLTWNFNEHNCEIPIG